MSKTTTERTRAFEMTLDIDAPAGDVWRALTEAEELVRWFPMEAGVTPGEGGTMRWSWGKGWDWETRIERWEPGRRLRLVQEDARPYDAQGHMLSPGEAEPARIAIEFTLETLQGKTRLRVVHSGFGEGAAWDDEVEGITEGWQAELRGLRHYLERHRGRNRVFKLAWVTTSLPRDAAWATLLGEGGFRITPERPAEGSRYEVLLPCGRRYSGDVVLNLPGQTVAGTVSELDDGWFRLLTWSIPGGHGNARTGVWVGMARYGEDDGRMEEFHARAEETLALLFPSTQERR